jgi:hypothetical protein
MEKQTQTKKLNILGYEITSNSCSALEYSLYVKKFEEWVVRTGHEQGFKLTMNHIQIHELLDEALNVEIKREDGSDDLYLIIETEEYKVSFKIPKVEAED